MRSNSGTTAWRCSTVLLASMLFAGPVMAKETEAGAGKSRGDEVACVALCTDPEASFGDMLFDAVVLRPLFGAQALIGIAAFAAAVPITLPSGRLDEAWDIFIQAPFDEAFTRKLGNF